MKSKTGKQSIIIINSFKVILDTKKLTTQKIKIHQTTLNITVE